MIAFQVMKDRITFSSDEHGMFGTNFRHRNTFRISAIMGAPLFGS